MEFEKNFCMQHIVLHFLLDKYKNRRKGIFRRFYPNSLPISTR